jgi:hypothetical protein
MRLRVTRLRGAAALLSVVLVMRVGAAAAAVSLQAGSVTVDAPFDEADVCVSLDTGGAAVAGTQNDLNWDGECASLPSEDSCAVAGMHGRTSAATHCGDFCLRAIVLSLTDVNPIPDGDLYCCRFSVHAAPGACCNLSVVAPRSIGRQGDIRGSNVAHLCVASDGQIGAHADLATVAPFAEDDGCRCVGPRHARIAPSLLVAGVLWFVRVARNADVCAAA